MKMRNPTEIPAALKNINLKAILRSRGIYDKQMQNITLKEAALPLAKKLVTERHKTPEVVKAVKEPRKYFHLSNEEAQAYWQKQIHVVEVNEAKFEKKLEQFIVKMVDGYLKELDAEVGTTKGLMKKAKGYWDEYDDDLHQSAQLDFGPILLDQAVVAGREAYKLTGLSGTYSPVQLRNTIRENINKFTDSMIDTDKNKLTSIVAFGVENGKSVSEIRSEITNEFDSFTKMQAQRVTRTEVLRVSNQAALDAYDESGVVEAKQWLTAGAVDECAQYEGQIVYLSDSFYDSSSEFDDGDPPLHPNCRCVVIPIVENSHPGKSLFEDESGSIQIADDTDQEQTFFRGVGGDFSSINTQGTNMFGDAFYVARTRSQAAQFGETILKFPEVKLPDSLILNISTQDQYDDFVKNSIKYAISNGKNVDTNVAIPAYIKHLGFKAAEVPDVFDPRGGIAIVDSKLKKLLKAAAESQKAIDNEMVDLAQKTKDLEDQLDKRTKEFRDLKDKQLEDEEYVKELEGLLDEKRTISEDF